MISDLCRYLYMYKNAFKILDCNQYKRSQNILEPYIYMISLMMVKNMCGMSHVTIRIFVFINNPILMPNV